MVDPKQIQRKIISTLDETGAQYKLFNHKPVFSYDDAAEAKKETGFEGTEGKCLVIRTDDKFIVYVTVQGRRINFDQVKRTVTAKKVRLATADELGENFGAVPGCAYPFGFDKEFDIYIDHEVYKQEWFLFSPAVTTQTIQIRGDDLKNVFSSLDNRVVETKSFNL